MKPTPLKLFRYATNGVLGTLIGVRTTSPFTALTFDDGPHPEYTPRLLAVLRKHKVRATFFMLGEMAARYPEVVRQVAEEGHAIGNHTWNHPSMPLIGTVARRRQWKACASAIAPYGSRFYRPPYGHQNLISRVDAMLMHYEVVGWTAHVQDWRFQPADALTTRILDKIVRGGILLLHDAIYDICDERASDRTFLLTALDGALSQLQGRYTFVTVPELLRHGPPWRKPWYKGGDLNWLRGSNTSWAEFHVHCGIASNWKSNSPFSS